MSVEMKIDKESLKKVIIPCGNWTGKEEEIQYSDLGNLVVRDMEFEIVERTYDYEGSEVDDEFSNIKTYDIFSKEHGWQSIYSAWSDGDYFECSDDCGVTREGKTSEKHLVVAQLIMVRM